MGKRHAKVSTPPYYDRCLFDINLREGYITHSMVQQRKKNFPLWAILTGIGILGFAVIVTIGIGAVIFLMADSDDGNTASASSINQENAWYAYLYNQNDQTVLRINEDGSTHTTDLLPAMEGESTSIETLAVGGEAGNEVVAYCTSMLYEENYSQILNIIDAEDGHLIQRHTIVDQLSQDQLGICRVSLKGISPDGQTVAVSLVNIDENNVFHWRLVLLDVTSGMIVKEVNSEMPNLADSTNNRFRIMPDVRRYTEDDIAFAVIPWGTEGIPVESAYVWDLATDTLTQTPRWGSMILDYLPASQELAWIEADENLPAGNPGGPIPNFNVVRVADDAGNIQTVYHNTDFLPIQIKFIDGGQALAIQLLASIDSATTDPGQQATKWVRLGRDGTLTDLRDTTGTYVQMMPFQDSYAFLVQTDLTSLEVNQGGNMNILWQTDAGSWSILGTAPLKTNDTDFAEFVAID